MASIVFVVANNPISLYSSDFLAHHEVFLGPEIKNEIKLPPFVRVLFEDGYSFEAAENKTQLKIDYQQPIELGEVDELPDILSDAADKLARVNPTLDYRALGINFGVLSVGPTLENRAQGLPKGSMTTELKFEVESHGYIAKYHCRGATRKTDGASGVLVDVNFHKDLLGIPKAERAECITTCIEERKSLLIRLERTLGDANF